jgi:hypothetical protein
VRQQLSGAYDLTHQEFQSLARIVLSQLELRPSAFTDVARMEREGGALASGAGMKSP